LGGSSLISVNPPQEWVRENGRQVRRPWVEHLTAQDMKRITEECENVQTTIPLNARNVKFTHKKSSTSGFFWGVNHEFAEAFNWGVEQGRFLNLNDLNKWRKVVVIGSKIKDELFGDKDAVGKEIKLDGQRFEVVGVMASKRVFENDWGDRVLLPYTTAAKRMIGNDYLATLIVYTKSGQSAKTAAEEIRRVLKRYKDHGDEFRIETAESQIQEVNKVFGIMKMVVGSIAFISLLVGGIGIMNIMLVSVTERTREIGIRKALGAKRKDILVQFLIESSFLCLCGGMLGVLFGLGLGFSLSQIITHLAKQTFTSVVSIEATMIALAFSALWGTIFGVYPAWKAARLDPVVALRYE
ncbi:MAG: ABC transporter permease, partial [Patescibacteria group bacterium]|nr:ABC transporter permease [Patescibacteria group bacterium]